MDFLPASDGRITAQLRAHLDHLSAHSQSHIHSHTRAPARAHTPVHSQSQTRLPFKSGANARAPSPPPSSPPCPPVYPSTMPGEVDDEPGYLPLSRTTDRVLRMLLEGDLSRIRAESVAEALGISCTTLRRRLRGDHTNYQFLLDRARQYRCESRLKERWLPGKCLADELGYLEVNSFYRAFRRWTGVSYSDYRQRFH